jgi:hypothetical protein
MQALLVEGSSNWRRDVLHYCRQPKPNAQVHETFRASRDSLQSGEPVASVIEKLIDALNKTTI